LRYVKYNVVSSLSADPSLKGSGWPRWPSVRV